MGMVDFTLHVQFPLPFQHPELYQDAGSLVEGSRSILINPGSQPMWIHERPRLPQGVGPQASRVLLSGAEASSYTSPWTQPSGNVDW